MKKNRKIFLRIYIIYLILFLFYISFIFAYWGYSFRGFYSNALLFWLWFGGAIFIACLYWEKIVAKISLGLLILPIVALSLMYPPLLVNLFYNVTPFGFLSSFELDKEYTVRIVRTGLYKETTLHIYKKRGMFEERVASSRNWMGQDGSAEERYEKVKDVTYEKEDRTHITLKLQFPEEDHTVSFFKENYSHEWIGEVEEDTSSDEEDEKTFSSAGLSYEIIRNYEGKIGGHPMQMELSQEVGSIYREGTYRYLYDTAKTRFEIRGWEGEDSIFFKGYYSTVRDGEKVNFGTGEGRLFERGDSLIGTWHIPNEDTILPFRVGLSENSEEDNLNHPEKYSFVIDYEEMGSHEKGVQYLNILYEDFPFQEIPLSLYVEEDQILNVVIEDFNFDGFYDFKIKRESKNSREEGEPVMYYLFDKEEKKFVESEVLNALRYLVFHHDVKRIEKKSRDWQTSLDFYHWANNGLERLEFLD